MFLILVPVIVISAIGGFSLAQPPAPAEALLTLSNIASWLLKNPRRSKHA